MGPPNPWTFALERFAVFLRDVIEPAVYPIAVPLAAEAFQCAEPVPAKEALSAAFSPVALGWQWGPRWSTAWFRLRGVVPASMAGRHVVLRFSTDTEALLWLADASGTPVPHHGLDANRDAVTLFLSPSGGEPVQLHVEAACNHMFGDRGLQWDPPEIHRRWNSATPGLFERCELAVRDDAVWRLRWVYAFVLDLARQASPDSARGQQLLGVLRRATNVIPDDAVAAAAAGAAVVLESALKPPAGGAAGSATLCHAVGHAHIDTAWLWPLRETKRKCLRTFSTVLRNMEADPDYRFLCSQAQQYEYVQERSPELFAQIKQRVAEGRWEPGGAMWIEPDCTCPSGESLIRQCLYADRYWRHHFGDTRGRQRFLYLPDTFGFPAQLPQIMRHCGLDTFITNKLHWNSHTTFPHTTFLWRGLDGSEVLAHQTPGMDYNASNTPKELVRGEKTHKNKDLPSIDAAGPGGARWLQPFGFGDGGGGPTDWSILYAHLAENCDALPRVRFSSATEFCEALHADVRHALNADPHAVPLHDGELYLELHRGTYTTHARMKHANAECEELLRQAEILTFAGPVRLTAEHAARIKSELDAAWKLVLLNQFHDILPGSSITWVYDDAARDYEEVRGICRPLIDAGAARWAAALAPSPTDLVCTVNLSNVPARPAADAAGVFTPHTAPMSIGLGDGKGETSEGDALERNGLTIQNDHFLVRFDEQGRIAELLSRNPETGAARTRYCGPGVPGRSSPLNQLALYEDRPRLWDAWDIDPEHVQKPMPVDVPGVHEVLGEAPGQITLRFSRALGRASRVVQTVSVSVAPHAPPVISFDTQIDWQEEHRLLKVLFPLGLRPERVRLGTQLGWRRPPSSPAAFEVPFQHSIVEDDTGLSWAFPDRYGASILGGTLGVSLLRSTRYPDPRADIGSQRVRYAIGLTGDVPDKGWWTDGFCRPPLAVALPTKAAAPGPTNPTLPSDPRRWSPLHTFLRVEAIKRAEDDDRLIVRLSSGDKPRTREPVSWHIPVADVRPVDGLERPLGHPGVEHDAAAGTTYLSLRPFEIVTLAVRRAD